MSNHENRYLVNFNKEINNQPNLSSIGLKIILSSLLGALAVFYRLRLLHYYDDRNKRHWIYDPDLDLRINTGR